MLGRETFLVPVECVDGWPVVGEVPLELPTPPGRWLPDRPSPRGTTSTSANCDRSGSPHVTAPPSRHDEGTLRPADFVCSRRLPGRTGRRVRRPPAAPGLRGTHPGRRGPGAGRGRRPPGGGARHYEIEVFEGEVRVHAHVGPLRTV